MSPPVSFEQYLDALGAMTPHVDPTTTTPQTQAIRAAVDSLQTITPVTGHSLAQWANEHPRWAHVLGLVVGLSQEKLLIECGHLTWPHLGHRSSRILAPVRW